MNYKLIISDRAEELFENLIKYLLYRLKNEQAASHLLDSMDKIYKRMEENPSQFPLCRDSFLKEMKYREAVITDMDYLVIFKVDENSNIVYVLGMFHSHENYKSKV